MVLPITLRDDLTNMDKLVYPEGSAERYRPDCVPGSIQVAMDKDRPDKCWIHYVCPCGCGRLRMVPGKTGEKVENRWIWNGSRDRPTLQPSIQCLQGCRWHGWLTDGVWTTC